MPPPAGFGIASDRPGPALGTRPPGANTHSFAVRPIERQTEGPFRVGHTDKFLGQAPAHRRLLLPHGESIDNRPHCNRTKIQRIAPRAVSTGLRHVSRGRGDGTTRFAGAVIAVGLASTHSWRSARQSCSLMMTKPRPAKIRSQWLSDGSKRVPHARR